MKNQTLFLHINSSKNSTKSKKLIFIELDLCVGISKVFKLVSCNLYLFARFIFLMTCRIRDLRSTIYI